MGKKLLPRAQALPQKKRSREGRLQDKIVTPGTLERYETAVRGLFKFWDGSAYCPETWDELDEACGEYIEALWSEGDSLGSAQDCLSGLKHLYPSAQGHLRFAWRLCKAWSKAEPAQRAAPVPPVIVLGLAGFFADAGLNDVCALLLVGFDTFLRSGELFSTLRKDVVLYKDRALVRLPSTKTGNRDGREEMVVVESPVALKWLRRGLSGLQPGQRLSHRSPIKLRQLLAAAVESFELQGQRITWYSLRRGGASWDFLSHGLMERTLLRGRWQSHKAARVYVQDAAAAVADLQIPLASRAALKKAAESL